MNAADCLPGAAVTVRAADDFYKFIDGWHGVVSDRPGAGGGCVSIDCINPDGQAVQFLVPPEQLENRHDETGEN
jgi:hypothetical protein